MLSNSTGSESEGQIGEACHGQRDGPDAYAGENSRGHPAAQREQHDGHRDERQHPYEHAQKPQKGREPEEVVVVPIAANALLKRATAVIKRPVQKKASRNALFGLLTRLTVLLSAEPHRPQNLASGGPSHPQRRHVRVCSVTSEPDYARELLPRSPTSVLYQHTAASLDIQGD